MEMTWVAIAASLLMGLGTACMFIFAVKRDWFHDLEDSKYQVFWSDPECGSKTSREVADGSEPEKS
jgi:hypothetical protein